MIVMLLNIYCSGISGMMVASRLGYVMARDQALPRRRSHYLAKIDPHMRTPLRMLNLVFAIEVAFCLIPIISPRLLDALTMIQPVCLQLSYAFPLLLRVTSARRDFDPKIRYLGSLSIPLTWMAVVWLVTTAFLMVLLPSQYNQRLLIIRDDYNDFNVGLICLLGVFLLILAMWSLPWPYGG